jgi:DNA-binding NarL/FixJ family response regulator
MVEVFVVAPVRVHRESLCLALNEAKTLRVAGGAATLTEALPRLREVRPDVAVVRRLSVRRSRRPASAESRT